MARKTGRIDPNDRTLARCWRNIGLSEQVCAWARWNGTHVVLWRSANRLIAWRNRDNVLSLWRDGIDG